jgi:Uma2 family endonuclease
MSATVLRDISWETYECLLKNYENSSSPRLTYDRGTLEIVSPLVPHEETNRVLDILVDRIADAWGVRLRHLGSTTLKSGAREQGVEPDSCFYIQNLPHIGRRQRIDLEGGDPPPDLVVEVDQTNPSLNKLAIYANLGVPEIWHVTEGLVDVLRLRDGTYQSEEVSGALAPLSRTAINKLLALSRVVDNIDWNQAVRGWATNPSS